MDVRSSRSLPPEIILCIYSDLPDFRNVVNLAYTCRTLYQIWRSKTAFIAEAVLEKNTKCFQDARALVEAQEIANPDALLFLSTRGGRKRAAAWLNLTRQQVRLLKNVDLVNEAQSLFLKSVGDELAHKVEHRRHLEVQPYRDPPFLSATEEERFTHAFYRVWKFLVLFLVQEPLKKQKLQSPMVEWVDMTEPRDRPKALGERWGMCEIAWFLMHRAADDHLFEQLDKSTDL